MQKVWHRRFDGWWYATLREGGSRRQIKLVKAPDTKDGRQLAEEQLVRELAQKQHAADRTDPLVASWLTVGHVLRGFLRHSREEHSPETAAWHEDLLEPVIKLWGKVRVTRLRKKHVRHWLKVKGYNPTSANKALGALKRAFNWAVEEEHIPKNPIAHVRKPKPLTRDRTLTPEERELILRSIRGPAFRLFVNAMTLTGARPGEVARVTAEDVDLVRGVWVLQKHKTAKKTGKPRVIYLCPEALELTKRLMAEHPGGPLFLNSRKRPWHKDAIRLRFKRLREKFPQLQGIIAYSYRTSFATDALESGVPDASVSALLGHTNTDTLHKFYNKLSSRTGHLKDAAAKAPRKPRGEAPPDTAA